MVAHYMLFAAGLYASGASLASGLAFSGYPLFTSLFTPPFTFTPPLYTLLLLLLCYVPYPLDRWHS